ncbi:MAG TPA: TraR/DksA C4-type zinc finger protein [bacterium]|nr:TraR/DksA C4-type zinc finger protein [bacterium]
MLTKRQIDHFRKRLLAELKEIEERNKEKVEELEQETNDPSDKFHGDEADQANFSEERSRLLRLRDRDRKLINKLHETLAKIDGGTYGICEACGTEIGAERLEMRPVAGLCIECKQKQEEREERDKALKRR